MNDRRIAGAMLTPAVHSLSYNRLSIDGEGSLVRMISSFERLSPSLFMPNLRALRVMLEDQSATGMPRQR